MDACCVNRPFYYPVSKSANVGPIGGPLAAAPGESINACVIGRISLLYYACMGDPEISGPLKQIEIIQNGNR